MAAKVRKHVYLDGEQARALRELAEGLGVSEAEVIRRALDAALPRGSAGPRAGLRLLTELARRRLALGPVTSAPSWTREDLYEERMARYGKQSHPRRSAARLLPT